MLVCTCFVLVQGVRTLYHQTQSLKQLILKHMLWLDLGTGSTLRYPVSQPNTYNKLLWRMSNP